MEGACSRGGPLSREYIRTTKHGVEVGYCWEIHRNNKTWGGLVIEVGLLLRKYVGTTKHGVHGLVIEVGLLT